MPNGYYWFWLLELCIGVLVGMSAAKEAPGRGVAITLLLGAAGVVELFVVTILRSDRGDIRNIVAQTISVMVFGFVLWGIALFFACAGYCSAFWVSGRLGVGGGQFSIGNLLALAALYAGIAAIGRML